MKSVVLVSLSVLLSVSYIAGNPIIATKLGSPPTANATQATSANSTGEDPVSWLAKCDKFWPRCSSYIASIGGIQGIAKYLRYAGLQDLGIGLINLMTDQTVADAVVLAAENGGTWLDHCGIFWPRCASYMASVGGLEGALSMMGSMGLQDLALRIVQLTNEQGGSVTMPTEPTGSGFGGMMGMDMMGNMFG